MSKKSITRWVAFVVILMGAVAIVLNATRSDVDIAWVQRTTGLALPKKFAVNRFQYINEARVECELTATSDAIEIFIRKNGLLSADLERTSLGYHSHYYLMPYDKLRNAKDSRYFIKAGHYNGGNWEVWADVAKGTIEIVVSYADFSGDY